MTTQTVCHEAGEEGAGDRSNLPGTIRTLDDPRGSISIICGRPCGPSPLRFFASPSAREKARGGAGQARLLRTMRERKDSTLITISLSVSPAKHHHRCLEDCPRNFCPDAIDTERATPVRRLAELHGGSVGAQNSGHDAHLVRPARPDRLAPMLATPTREPDLSP